MTFNEQKKIIDDLLADPYFQKALEEDIGKIKRVTVNWDEDLLLFESDEKYFRTSIRATIMAALELQAMTNAQPGQHLH